MAKDENIAQVAQGYLFEGTFVPPLRPVEGVVTMTFDEAGPAPPMRPITIQTTKLSFPISTCSARQACWGQF